MKLTIIFDVERPNLLPVQVTITNDKILNRLSKRASYRNMYLEDYVVWLLENIAELRLDAHVFEAVKR